MNFHDFKHVIATNFAHLSQFPLFRTAATKDDLWGTYLSSFPEGSNPIFRKRTHHDCSCCRQFIKAVGNVVALTPDHKILTIWDLTPHANLDPAYAQVATAMAELVKSHPVENVFVHDARTAGTDKNFEDTLGGVKTWEHFFVNVPAQFVKPRRDIPTYLGEVRSTFDVFKRGLMEFDRDALDTVLELIAQNSLYRGEEHKHNLTKFRAIQAEFDKLDYDWQRNHFAWTRAVTLPQSLTRLRNTSIGTLLQDLSNNVDLEQAVKKFEAMVAPANYKRPTALVTPAMIAKAKETVSQLGLTSALERRYATLQDITAPNTLFVNRSAVPVTDPDAFDELMSDAARKVKPNLDRVDTISIDNFLANIVPQATSIEVFVENRHQNNLVSLIAPADPTANKLFKWDNLFSWSYNGDFADSIKERVKKAGGNVEGDVCCRLAWFNNDDLDFHMVEPGGYEIYYGNKRRTSPSGGMLDVDMNGGDGLAKDRRPVENIFYSSASRMRSGIYHLLVNQFSKRETIDVGFEVEIDIKGTVHTFAYDQPVRGNVPVADIVVAKDGTIEIKPHLPSTTTSKTIWNLPTQQFHPVNILMNSPNYWDGNSVGNRHFFFMLDGCRNDGTARGFYNEFLKSELDQHRKVFEMVGAKMRTDETEHQLSGLGFSSTQRNHVLVKVTGAFTRTLKVEI